MIRERAILANAMRESRLESHTITTALERLKAVHPVRVADLHHEVNGQGRDRWDGEVMLKTDRGAFRYVFEVKTHLRPQTVNHLIVRAQSFRKHEGKGTDFLLIADYVNPLLASQLQEAGINFIDTVGNLFLKREPGLYLYVEGKKPAVLPRRKPTRLFQPSGLKLLFGLLLEPESVNAPYRHLADANGIALGTVGWVKRDLREQGYLEPVGKDRFHLVKKKELVERWVQGYAHLLRPKVFLGEYRDLENNLDTVVKTFRRYALEEGARWGLTGGFGADQLIHHYRGASITFFIERWDERAAIKELRWVPVSGGPITVLKAFSPMVFAQWGKAAPPPALHPLLIYAELLYRGSDRELETARLIYNEYLEPSFAKD